MNNIIKPQISLVIPVYNEASSLRKLNNQIIAVLAMQNYANEIFYIDDGSLDDSLSVLLSLKDKSKNIKIIQLRRNFGKAAALSAGFSEAQGELIITLDADLQDDPAEIPKFIEKLNQGYDLISGWKQDRQDPIIKVISSKLFNWQVRRLTGIQLHDFNCGFKIFRREVIKNIKIYGEMHRFLPVLAHQQGFRVGEIKINHRPRIYGKSKYGRWGLRRFSSFFLDPINIILLTKYQNKPAHFFGNAGLILFGVGFIINLYLTILWFLGQRPIGNRPLLFLGILLIIISVQLISLGLLGEMIYSQGTKNEKHYSIKAKFF